MSSLDWLVIALYGGVVVSIGVFAGRGHGSSRDLMLGGRDLPVWAVICSMVATELSAATFMGVPHGSYTGDWFYLQFAFGALAGKLILAATLIPLYHRLGVVTVYGFIEHRFGKTARRVTALFFIIGRIIASGVRLYIAAIALVVVTGLGLEASIIVCGLVAGAYTLIGGIRAVVWTDTLQGAVFIIAAVASIVTLALNIDGGIGGIFQWASSQESDRLTIFVGEPLIALASDRPFLVGIIGGMFLTLATHGTDHDMVQRLLTTRDGRRGARALVVSGLVNFPVVAVFLFIGTGLAAYYSIGGAPPPENSKQVFAVFAVDVLPVGLRGLFFAGLFAAAMSSLDSAICAIATTWVADVQPIACERRRSRHMRGASAVVCLLLVSAALGAAWYQAPGDAAGAPGLDLVRFALASMSIIYGGLLGVFLLGFLTRTRGSPASVIAGLVAGSLAGLTLFLQPVYLEETRIAWPWWIVIGCSISFTIGALGSGHAREGEEQ